MGLLLRERKTSKERGRKDERKERGKQRVEEG